MTTWSQERRLELVFDKTLDAIYNRMKTVDKDDRRALRREFQGWFSTPWNDIDVLWLEYFQEWEDEKCQ